MAATFRVRMFTGTEGSPAGGPCEHIHRTLKSAQTCLARVRKAGHGGGIQIRLAPSEPWSFIDRKFEGKE